MTHFLTLFHTIIILFDCVGEWWEKRGLCGVVRGYKHEY